MLSKKIFNTIQRRNPTAVAASTYQSFQSLAYSQKYMLLTQLSAAQFGGCGSKKKSLSKFSDQIQKDIMAPAPTHLAEPTLRNTKIREAYSEEFDRTPHCSGCQKCGDWERDVPLMSIQDAVREAARCLKCNDAPCQ